MKKLSFIILIIFFINGCFILKQDNNKNTYSIDYNEVDKLIKLEKPDTNSLAKFNPNVLSNLVTIKKDTLTITGYRTENKVFYNEVIKPTLLKYKTELQKLNKKEALNEIAIFIHQVYRAYLGNEIYRWGGDINDLDDPQGESHRGKYKYGLDCSGYVTSAYEVAVDLGILNPNLPEALFSSKGFDHYCKTNNFKDSGGIKDTPNNYRVDTKELAVLGELVFSINKGEKPTEKQISLLQPGDIVGRSGHFGIIVFINNKPYYLESGGWVVPKNNWLPCEANYALETFAKIGDIYIRRVLP